MQPTIHTYPLELAADQIRLLAECDSVLIFPYDGHTDSLSGYPHVAGQYPCNITFQEELLKTLSRSRNEYDFIDINKTPMLLSSWFTQHGMKTLIYAALRIHNKLIGLVILTFKKPRQIA